MPCIIIPWYVYALLGTAVALGITAVVTLACTLRLANEEQRRHADSIYEE